MLGTMIHPTCPAKIHSAPHVHVETAKERQYLQDRCKNAYFDNFCLEKTCQILSYGVFIDNTKYYPKVSQYSHFG